MKIRISRRESSAAVALARASLRTASSQPTRVGCRHTRATLLALAAFCLPAPAQDTDAALLRSLSLLDAREKATLAGNPALLKQVVRFTYAQQLLLSEARENRWDKRPEVQAKMERARDTALAESWLQSVSEPPPDYPGTDELKAAYEAQKKSLATPRQFQLAQIFIACPQGADNTAVQKAAAKLAAVRKTLASCKEDFAAIARRGSEDAASAADGGEIGWLTEAQIQPELRPHITRLLKHEISAPVRLNDGWHIIKCLDKRDAGTPSLEDMRVKLVTQLRAERMKANSEAYAAKLLKENPVTVDETAFARTLPSPVKGNEPETTPTPSGK